MEGVVWGYGLGPNVTQGVFVLQMNSGRESISFLYRETGGLLTVVVIRLNAERLVL